jgi:glycosyltransferase involved in cell wall biosynthesis
VKIVSVLTSDAEGGAEFAAVEMLDALSDRGHDAVLFTNQPRLTRDTAVRPRDIALGPKLSTRTCASLAATAPWRLWQLRSALASERPYDVLLVHYKKEQLLAGALPAGLRATLAWAEWGPVPFPMRRGIPRRAYLWAARRTAFVMAISEGTRASLREVGLPASKLHVVPNVMRTDEIVFLPDGRERVRGELGIPDRAFVVGCMSRFHPKKRNDVVIDAVAALPDAHLILAGGGETEAELRERARPLGARAHFVPTARGRVAEVLSAFDVSVFCPSPTEGAPRAVILAMLAERPCVATGAEGVADMIDGDIGGITFPENDPAALATMLRGYLEEPARIPSQGREARRRAVARYSAPVVAQQIERLFLSAEEAA